MLNNRPLTRLDRIALLSLLGMAPALLAGCGKLSFYDLFPTPGTGPFDANTLVIRVVNNSNLESVILLRVDLGEGKGLEDVTITCRKQGVADAAPDPEHPEIRFFSPCPTTIQVIEKRLFDTSGAFVSGIDFTGNPTQFTYHQGTYRCGSILILRFGADDFEVLPL